MNIEQEKENKIRPQGLKEIDHDLSENEKENLELVKNLSPAFDISEKDLLLMNLMKSLFILLAKIKGFDSTEFLNASLKEINKMNIFENADTLKVMEKKSSSQYETLLSDKLKIYQENFNKNFSLENNKYKSLLETILFTNLQENYIDDLLKKKPEFYLEISQNPTTSLPKTMNSNEEKNISYAIPTNIIEKLEKVDEFDFNCFEFHEFTNGQGLCYLLPHLFVNYGLFNINKFEEFKIFNFSQKIQNGYLDNPYHNKIHGFDVCQTVNVLLNKCKFMTLANLSHLEIAAMILAAAVHDFEHPGYNNMYLVNTRNQYALRYNDKSVLENHHIAASWLITMSDEKYNIFEKLDREEYYKVRERMISMVLATDMSLHFSSLAKMKARLTSSDFDMKEKDKHSCMDLIVHAADMSNPIKKFDLYAEWTDRLLTEYWNQGDQEREKGLPISYLMDRYTVNTAKSQIGLINVIVQPLFAVINSILPEVDVFLKNLQENLSKWSEKIDFYEDKLKILKEENEKKDN